MVVGSSNDGGSGVVIALIAFTVALLAVFRYMVWQKNEADKPVFVENIRGNPDQDTCTRGMGFTSHGRSEGPPFEPRDPAYRL